jgi:AcrR family transcriptional regulator
MRGDAQRNRERIIETAREVFREHGYDASLDDIAKRADVGPGTLYRHFPQRETLVNAVMQSWVDPIQVSRLVGAVAAVSDQGELDHAALRPMLEVIADGLLVRT